VASADLLDLAPDVLDVSVDRPLVRLKATPFTASSSWARVKTRQVPGRVATG
jgi:hypothetical protein